jgi:hypothetical protein
MIGNAGLRRHPAPWMILGVVVAAVVVIGFGPSGRLLTHVTACRLGDNVGSYTIWTPDEIVNIPDNGSVTVGKSGWNVTMTSGSLSTGSIVPSGGSESTALSPPQSGIYAEYFDVNWTVYQTQNVSEVGASAGPCTQPYVAESSGIGLGCGGGTVIPLIENSSDAVEPHVYNGSDGFNGSQSVQGCPKATPGTYVWFDSSFHSGGTGYDTPVSWNLCGHSSLVPLDVNSTAQLPVVVTVPFEGHTVSASGLLTWYDSSTAYGGPTVVYHVPGGWVWTLAPVGPISSPIDTARALPGLVAFERSSC